ncbi:MAG: DUF1573 domain-containing protein [Ghiorsea sp.]
MVKSLIVIAALFIFASCSAVSKPDPQVLPLLHIQPAVYELGDIKEGEEATATFLIRNNSPEMVTIVDIQASCGCTAAQPDSYMIPAYGFTQLKVAVDTTAKQDHIKKTIHITDSLGNQSMGSLTFSVIDNSHFVATGKPKGIFEGQCASCHYTPVLTKKSGKAIYEAACVMCHGQDGVGAYAPRLQGYSSLAMLKHVITNGVGKAQMPAFSRKQGGPLQDVQIDVLAKWLMSLPKNKEKQ